jgi:glycosyltransferase involved in cell wall biosynthesis
VSGKLEIFIPAYNEERPIAAVVLLAKKYGKVTVIDDGSTDRTAALASLAGASVIRRGRNGGYGAACKDALAAARKSGAGAFVFLDGDMQHDPDEILRVAGPVLSGECDVCLGSRFLGRLLEPPPYRKEAVQLVNRLSGLRAGSGKLDFECGFRAFSPRAVKKILLSSEGYAACSEAIVLALEAGLEVKQVPVSIRYFEGRDGNPLAQGAGLIGNIANAMMKKKPLLFFAGSGFAMLASSALLGIFVVRTYYSTQVLATGSAFLTVFSGITGFILLSIGINLYILETLLEQRRGREG